MIANAYEYELDYLNFLAEKELLDELSVISMKYVIVTEADAQEVKKVANGSIMKYIRKIIANIQAAWDKFKATVDEKTWNKMKEYYKKEFSIDNPLILQNVQEDDVLPIFKNIDSLININNGIMVEADLNKFNDKLDILKAFYGNTYFGKAESADKNALQKIANKNCFIKPVENDTIGLDKLKNYIDFMDKYKSYVDKVSDDITKINDTEKLLERIINTQNNTPEPAPQANSQQSSTNTQETNTEAVINHCMNVASSYLIELTYGSANNPQGNANQNNNPDNENKKKPLSKSISDIMGVFSTILSVKMSVLNKAKRISFTVCRNYGRYGRENTPVSTNTSNDNNTDSGTGATQIKK